MNLSNVWQKVANVTDKLTKSAFLRFWLNQRRIQKENRQQIRLTWHKTDILWNLLKESMKSSKPNTHTQNMYSVTEQKHCVLHALNARFLVLIIIKWKAVLILFALFIRISYYSIAFYLFHIDERQALPSFLFLFVFFCALSFCPLTLVQWL